MIRSVLVGIGGPSSPGAGYNSAATEVAIDLAKRHGASLTGVTVANLQHLDLVASVPLGAAAAAAEMRDHRIETLRRRIAEAASGFERACGAAGVRGRVVRDEEDEPLACLISQARYHDLTVVGLRGLFEYGVGGEAHYDPADLLVRLVSGGVRPIVAVGAEPRHIDRVLVAYSGSPQSAKAMRRFIQLRPWEPSAVRIVAFGDNHHERQEHLRDAAAYLKEHGIDAERDYRRGDPRRGILEVAEEWGADLVVMGNSHRTLLARKVLGDTLLEVLRNSELSLFLAQ